MTRLSFRALGPLEVLAGERTLELGPPLQRAVLARLLVDAGRVVSVERLVDDLWDERPPAHAAGSLHAYISNLRRVLEPDRPRRAPARVVRTRSPGYVLEVDGHVLDLLAFEEAVAAAQRAAQDGADHRAVRAAADEALSLWRGPVLADLADVFPFVQREAVRLDALRSSVEELRLQARVHGGEHLEVLPELEAVVRAEPLREGAWELLVLALYRAGRTGDALARCRDAMRILREELGVEPGAALQRLHAAVLDRDPSLDAVPATNVAIVPDAVARPARPGLVGRDDDITVVTGLLRTARLVTITGPGGVGKTSLALRAADRAGGGSLGEVVVVELASVADPAELVPTVARALDLQDVSGDPIGRTAAALRGRRVLLVLDNVEQLLEAAADVALLVDACPELSVLVTSRARLSVTGEREYPLAPLELARSDRVADALASPAVELLLTRVTEILPSFRPSDDDVRALSAICRRLDGLPLAIELVAPWLKVLTPQDLLLRIGDALAAPGAGPRDVAARQRTISDTVAWSFELLDQAQRRAFATLSVFPAGWTLDAASAVLEGTAGVGEPTELLAIHASLVEQSLVVRVATDGGTTRFRLLETVRDFAAQALADEQRVDEVSARHAAWVLAQSEVAADGLRGPEQVSWLRRLRTEHDDLVAAARWFLDAGEHASVVRLVWNLRWYVHITARHRQVVEWLDELRDAPLAPDVRAAWRAVAGLCAYGLGRWQEVPGADGGSADELVQGADADVAALTLLVAAHGAVGRNDPDRAGPLAIAAAARARALGDAFEEGIALLAFAQLVSDGTEVEVAGQQLATAEATLRRAGAAWGIAVALNIRALLEQVADAADARPLLAESLQLLVELGDLAALVYQVTTLGVECARWGSLEAAAELLGAAERLGELSQVVQAPEASRRQLEQADARLRDGLSPERLDELRAAGRARSIPEIIELAAAHC